MAVKESLLLEESFKESPSTKYTILFLSIAEKVEPEEIVTKLINFVSELDLSIETFTD
jgi:hypothetical protein